MIINDLPHEIQLQIFSYLNLPEAVAASRVCKQWKELLSCDLIWTSFLKLFPDVSQCESGDARSLVLRKVTELKESSANDISKRIDYLKIMIPSGLISLRDLFQLQFVMSNGALLNGKFISVP